MAHDDGGNAFNSGTPQVLSVLASMHINLTPHKWITTINGSGILGLEFISAPPCFRSNPYYAIDARSYFRKLLVLIVGASECWDDGVLEVTVEDIPSATVEKAGAQRSTL
jgi:hypothetical protein